MNDRELLEAAAKAAGLTIHSGQQAGRDACGAGGVGLWISNLTTCWNPLTDDGDALRLAVKLKIHPEIFSGYTVVFYAPDPDGDWLELEEWSDDPYETTRRAIVRAAAEIGRSKE